MLPSGWVTTCLRATAARARGSATRPTQRRVRGRCLRRSVKRSISSARLSSGGAVPHLEQAAAERAARARDRSPVSRCRSSTQRLPAGRAGRSGTSCGSAPSGSISRAPRRSTRRNARLTPRCPSRRTRAPSPRPLAAPLARRRRARMPSGRRRRSSCPSAPASSAARLRLGETRQQPAREPARRCGRRSRGRAARVAAARAPRRSRRPAPPDAARSRASTVARQHAARLGGAQPLRPDAPGRRTARRHGEPHHVERVHRADEHDAAEQRRRDVVEMPARDRLFGDEARLEQRVAVERRAQQRVRRPPRPPRPTRRCHPGRRRAAAPCGP